MQDISVSSKHSQNPRLRCNCPPLTDKQRFVVGPIDPRLALERCSLPVKPMVGPGGHMRDRILVELRCPGTPAWHIYVPVRVVGTSSVTIAAHAIVVGSVLSDKDVRVEQRDIRSCRRATSMIRRWRSD